MRPDQDDRARASARSAQLAEVRIRRSALSGQPRWRVGVFALRDRPAASGRTRGACAPATVGGWVTARTRIMLLCRAGLPVPETRSLGLLASQRICPLIPCLGRPGRLAGVSDGLGAPGASACHVSSATPGSSGWPTSEMCAARCSTHRLADLRHPTISSRPADPLRPGRPGPQGHLGRAPRSGRAKLAAGGQGVHAFADQLLAAPVRLA
jgi:hypothetical protein